MKTILKTVLTVAGQLTFFVIILLVTSNQLKSLSVDVSDHNRKFPSQLVTWCGDGCNPELECCYLCSNGCIYRINYQNCSRECL